MVLSGSKRTTHIASIVNQDTGGGSKKAGLPYQIGREASISVAFRNTSSNLIFLQGPKAMLKNKLKIAMYYLNKALKAQTEADALVVSKIATADALENVTVTADDNDAAIQGKIDTLAAIDPQTQAETDAIAALQAIIDARAAVAPHGGLVAAEQVKVDTAQANLDAYTADI